MCPTCSGLRITGPPPKLCACSPVTADLVVDLWNEVDARKAAIPCLRQPLRVAEICEVLSEISDYPGERRRAVVIGVEAYLDAGHLQAAKNLIALAEQSGTLNAQSAFACRMLIAGHGVNVITFHDRRVTA